MVKRLSATKEIDARLRTAEDLKVPFCHARVGNGTFDRAQTWRRRIRLRYKGILCKKLRSQSSRVSKASGNREEECVSESGS
ncbi:hypothetical protein HPP92_028344 [Vanilla planifolia]|uniref:Uncharacterized protein n=1 Tax=Vanilla planifolia TaxID=51239 RepID=A0A835U2V0_VANPL|nr:hypothetical protein HPP92_028344 [Vanilla planifolia]KAG0447474.1 hypothetical protein HPP92_028328 [Vanilla planifolia]